MTARPGLSWRGAAVHAALGLLWGVLLADLPDVFWVGLIPIALIVGFVLTRRFKMRGAVLAPVFAVAAMVAVGRLGTKYEDLQRFEDLPGTWVTMRQLKEHGGIHYPHELDEVTLQLPNASPTYREVAEAVRRQLGRPCQYNRCATSATIRRGCYIMFLSVR